MLGRDPINFLLQKTGHFLEYALLALVLYRAVRGTLWILRGAAPAPAPGRGRLNGGVAFDPDEADPELTWGPYFWTLALTFLYAVSDEWHQSFIPRREATLRDVLIDAAGALTALLIARWAAGRRHNRGLTPLAAAAAAGPANTGPEPLGPQPG